MAKNPKGPNVPMPKMKKGLKAYLKDVATEMRRVIWPSRAETVRLTSGVLIVCVLFVLYLWAAGYVVSLIIRLMEGQRIF